MISGISYADILTLVIPLSYTGLFFYTRGVNKKMDRLMNGCFARHMDLAKQEGVGIATMKSLHERIDMLEHEVRGK